MNMKYGWFTGCEDFPARENYVNWENLPKKCCAHCDYWTNETGKDFGMCEKACNIEWDIFSYADDCCCGFEEAREMSEYNMIDAYDDPFFSKEPIRQRIAIPDNMYWNRRSRLYRYYPF